MKEENQVKAIQIAAGCFLATLYAAFGVNGMVLIMAAFLLGIPLDKLIPQRKEE